MTTNDVDVDLLGAIVDANATNEGNEFCRLKLFVHSDEKRLILPGTEKVSFLATSRLLRITKIALILTFFLHFLFYCKLLNPFCSS